MTPDGVSQNVKVKQKKITEETVTRNQKESTPDGVSQNVKVKQKKITEEIKATVTTNQKESTPDAASQNVKVKQKKITEENKATVTTNQKESTPDRASQNDPPAEILQQKITEEKKSTPHEVLENVQQYKITEEDKAMDIEVIPVMRHVYAKSPQNKIREENKASIATNQEMDDKLPTNGKLTYEQHKTAYPGVHAASNNTFIKTDLVKQIKYVNNKNIEEFLTTNMKKLLTKTIKLQSDVNQRIEKKSSIFRMKNIIVIFVLLFSKKKYNAIRHVRIELGYKENRCSFSNFMANSTSPIYKHYATNYGIPKEWIFSQKLTDFVVDNCNNTYSDPDSD